MRRCAALVTIVTLALSVLGCGPTAKKPVAKPDPPAHEDEHHHPGPNGGLVAEVSEHEYHVEWTHNEDAGSVTLIVLDADKKNDVPIAMEKLVVVADGKEYTLDALNPVDGKSARFELKDPDFLGKIEALGPKVTAEIKELDINGKSFKNVKLVEHHDH